MDKKERSHKRKMLMVLVIVMVCIVVTFLTGFLVVHIYINKINIVTDEEISIITPSDDEYANLTPTEDVQSENAAPTEDSPQEVVQSLEDQILENLKTNSEDIVYSEDVFNVLLIGSDTRVPGQRARSDVCIIISINKKTEKIVMTSILRDTYLYIPGVGNDRINASYAYGGAQLLLETIYQNFKIKIDKYLYVEFLDFIKIMDAIGPIELTIESSDLETLNYYMNEINNWKGDPEGNDYFAQGGTYMCNGKQVLAYVRNRYTRNGDFDRTGRQREVLQIAYDKIENMNILQLKNLLDVALPAVTTNLTEGEIFSLVLALPQYADYDLVMLSVPADGTFSYLTISGKAVLGINFQKNIDMLKQEIYGFAS